MAKKGKLPAKYRNPETGETWSGWARPPAWIANEKDRSKFLIDAEPTENTARPKATARKAATKKATAKKSPAAAQAPAAVEKKAKAAQTRASGASKKRSASRKQAANAVPQEASAEAQKTLNPPAQTDNHTST